MTKNTLQVSRNQIGHEVCNPDQELHLKQQQYQVLMTLINQTNSEVNNSIHKLI